MQGINEMTVSEIKEKLDELGIEYDSKANKKELVNLLNDVEGKHQEDNQVDEDKRFIVIQDFTDLADDNTVYHTGDIYPRRFDSNPSLERIDELLTDKNKQGRPVIQERD